MRTAMMRCHNGKSHCQDFGELVTNLAMIVMTRSSYPQSCRSFGEILPVVIELPTIGLSFRGNPRTRDRVTHNLADQDDRVTHNLAKLSGKSSHSELPAGLSVPNLSSPGEDSLQSSRGLLTVLGIRIELPTILADLLGKSSQSWRQSLTALKQKIELPTIFQHSGRSFGEVSP